jgi:hypothetical protein
VPAASKRTADERRETAAAASAAADADADADKPVDAAVTQPSMTKMPHYVASTGTVGMSEICAGVYVGSCADAFSEVRNACCVAV